MPAMRSMARVTGCRPPRSPRRPGRVTSMRSEARRASSAACSSAARRSPMAFCRRCLTRLSSAPRALRSSGGNLPRVFNSEVTVPFLPSRPTRRASSASRDEAPAMWSKALSILSKVSIKDSRGACSRRAGIVRRPGLPMADGTRLASGPKQKRGEGQAFSPLARIISPGAARRNDRNNLQAGLRFFGDGAKRLDVVHGQVGQHTTINLDAGLVQAVDQAAVAQVELARGRVDAHDPQAAELALLLLAADVGVLVGLDDRLLGDAINLAAGVVITLRAADDFLVTTACVNATFDSCHGSVLLRRTAACA